MKKDLLVKISGLGFYRLSEQRKNTLRTVLLASLVIHLIGLAAFGSYVVMRSFTEEKTVFTAPPPIKTYKPRELEHRVKVQKQQRSSSRPAIMPRMVSSAKTAQFSLPDIKMDPKIVQTSFQPKFKAITGVGLGVGLGTGFGVSGFSGLGVTDFNFFGIRGRGDKIAILVDISVSMVEEERGGPDGYDRVRQRIGKVIDAFNEQALFNIIVFADAGQTWKPEMQSAVDKNKAEAKAFLAGYNTKNNYGLSSGNVSASDIGKRAGGGTTRLDLALTAAFQQGADTILIISDGIPRVQKLPSEEEMKSWNNRMEAWRKEHEGSLQAYEQAMGQVQWREEKVWVPPQPARAAVLRENGGHGAQEARPGHWTTRRVPDRPLPHRPAAPSMPDSMKWWTFGDFVEHFGKLGEEYYAKKGKKLPIVHTIGYAIDKEGGDFLRNFSKEYKGSYRRVGSM